MRKSYFVLPALLALSVVGCHDGSKGDDREPNILQAREEKAHLNLAIHREGAGTDARILRLQVADVEVQTKGGRWIPLAAGSSRVQMVLKADAPARVVDSAELPSGDYKAVRLKLDKGSVLVNPTKKETELQTPDVLQGDLDWSASKREQVGLAILLDPHQALGRDGSLAILSPSALVLRDLRTSRTLKGVLKEAGTGKPLAGRRVTVQAPPRSGGPGQGDPMTILRTAITRKDGSYELDLLPSGLGYRVVVPPTATHDMVLGASFDPGTGDLVPQNLEAAPVRKEDARTLDVPARGDWDDTLKSHVLVIERRADEATGKYVIVETLRRERNETMPVGPVPQGEYRVRLMQWGPGPVRMGRPDGLQMMKIPEPAATK